MIVMLTEHIFYPIIILLSFLEIKIKKSLSYRIRLSINLEYVLKTSLQNSKKIDASSKI